MSRTPFLFPKERREYVPRLVRLAFASSLQQGHGSGMARGISYRYPASFRVVASSQFD